MSGREFNFEELDKAVNAAMNGSVSSSAKKRGVSAASVSSFNGYSQRNTNTKSNEPVKQSTTNSEPQTSKRSSNVVNRTRRGVSATSILGGPQIAKKSNQTVRKSDNKIQEKRQESPQSQVSKSLHQQNGPKPKPRSLVRKKVIMDIVPNKKPDDIKFRKSRQTCNANIANKNIDGILTSTKKTTCTKTHNTTNTVINNKDEDYDFSRKIRSMFDKNTESKLEEYKKNSLALSTKRLKPVKKQEIKLPEKPQNLEFDKNKEKNDVANSTSKSSETKLNGTVNNLADNSDKEEPKDNLITHFVKPTDKVKLNNKYQADKTEDVQKNEQDNHVDTAKLEEELDKIIPKSKNINKEDFNKSPFVEDAPIEKRPLGSIPSVAPINKNLVSEHKIERKKTVSNSDGSFDLNQANADFPNKIKAKSKLSNQNSVQTIFDNETHVKPKVQPKIHTPGWVWALASVSILVTTITVLVILWYLEIIRF